MSLQYFEGDLLLIETPDGGDTVIQDGLILADRTFSTSIYISLFGGNKNDSGKVKTNQTWWGNTLPDISKNEKIVSRFQNTILTLPLTVKNIKAAEAAAELDLAWIIEEGIGDKVKAAGRTEGKNKFRLQIVIEKAGVSIYENSYGALWGAGINGI